MKCYNHHDRDAFAVCTSCGKGLCLECIKEVKGKVLCKDNKKCKPKACKCALVAITLLASLTAIGMFIYSLVLKVA